MNFKQRLVQLYKSIMNYVSKHYTDLLLYNSILLISDVIVGKWKGLHHNGQLIIRQAINGRS